MHVALKIGIGVAGVAALVGIVKVLDGWAAPDEPEVPTTTLPLPSGNAALGVEHLVGRTPAQVASAYFARDDVDQDGMVRYIGANPEGTSLMYKGVTPPVVAYRTADAAGNGDGNVTSKEWLEWIGGLGLVDRPMTVTVADQFLATVAYTPQRP